MTHPEKTIPLSTHYSLLHSELALTFPTPTYALQFQSLRPESRIYPSPKSALNTVYLPRPAGLTGVRSSSQYASTYSLVLDFDSPGALKEWQRRAELISVVFNEKPTSAYILREIRGSVFDAVGGVGKGVAEMGLGEGEKGKRTPELYIQDPRDPKRFIHYDPNRDRRERQRQG